MRVSFAPILLFIAGFAFSACATVPIPSGVARSPAALRDAELQGQENAPFAVVRDTNADNLAFLRTPSRPVDPQDPALPGLLARMKATLRVEQGVGIAAPQVGLHLRVIWVQRLDKIPEKPLEACLNPEILSYGESRDLDWEGCLSVIGGFGKVLRPTSIVLRCTAPDGTIREEPIVGRTARIFQHEIDHLNGILFIDRMTPPSELVPKEVYRARRAEEAKAAAQPTP